MILLMVGIIAGACFGETLQIDWPLFKKQTLHGVRIETTHNNETTFAVFKGHVPYEYGDRVQLTGTRRSCRPPRNKGMFNECAWWYRQGIQSQLMVTQHRRISTGHASVMLRWVSQWPEKIYRLLDTHLNTHASLMYTILFGNRIDYLTHELKRQFSSVGLIHLLVVSGAQIGLISMAIFRICRWVRLPFLIGFFGLIMIQCLYLMITGVDASILRSVVMTNIILFHRFYSLQRYPLWWYIIGAAIIVAIIIPNASLSPGFWYSFVITFGLLFFLPKIQTHVHGPRFAMEYTLASMVAVACSIPIQLIQNNIIQPTALMANLWVSWMSSILLFLGLGVLCLAPLWPWLASGLGIITSFLLKVMVHVTQPFYSSPIPVPYPLNYWLSIVIFLIPVMIFYPKSCRKVMILMGIIGGIIVACLFQRTLVVAIDVGQGDATLIVDGFKSVLIDTGGRYRGKSMAQTHILPVLNYYGIRTLDAMILTHHDLDHIGGVADVYRRGVVNTYSSKPLNLSNMIVVDAPQRLGLPRGWLDITPMAPIMSAFSSNNQSVLVSVYLKGYSFLITGDIDETAELAFIQAHHPSVHTVYKLGHHGSQSSTSSELLNTLQPTMAWNSAGRDNRYGHPHTSVISRLNDRGIPWLATDTHGAIYFKIQATTLTVSSELGHERWVIPSNL